VAYPSRPSLDVLPAFDGTANTRQTPEQRAALLAFVASEDTEGRSLRELCGLTGRKQTAIRRALHQAGIPLRGRGARPIRAPNYRWLVGYVMVKYSHWMIRCLGEVHDDTYLLVFESTDPVTTWPGLLE
jgi:hypothetical protein